MLVCAVVVHHDMQLQSLGELPVRTFEKLQELLVAVPSITLSDHLARPVQIINRGESGCGLICSRI
jgi:hypothetical protein